MVRLGNADKVGVVEGAPEAGGVSGFFGRLANKEGVPEGGGVDEVALKGGLEIWFGAELVEFIAGASLGPLKLEPEGAACAPKMLPVCAPTADCCAP